MNSTELTAAHRDAGKRRRLGVLVVVGLVSTITFGVVSSYSHRRVSQEETRLRSRAATVSVTPTAVLDAAYSSGNEIADALAVSPERVAFSAALNASEPCVTVRSSFLLAVGTLHFEVQDGSLVPTEGC